MAVGAAWLVEYGPRQKSEQVLGCYAEKLVLCQQTEQFLNSNISKQNN